MRHWILVVVLGMGSLLVATSAQAAVWRAIVVEVSDQAMYVKEIDNVRAAMKRLKLEATVRVMKARFAGENTGRIVVVSEYKDLAGLAAADAALAADAETQATMKRIDALRKIVSDSIYQEM